MRTFEELSIEDRDLALANATADVVYQVITGLLEIKFSVPSNQEAYENLMDDAKTLDSIRHAQYGMLNHRGICTEIEKIALIMCVDSKYDNNGNMITKEKRELQ